MNKQQLLLWLQRNKPFINIQAIGRAAGVSNLKNIVNNTPDGRGYLPTLADKHLPALREVVAGIRKNS